MRPSPWTPQTIRCLLLVPPLLPAPHPALTQDMQALYRRGLSYLEVGEPGRAAEDLKEYLRRNANSSQTDAKKALKQAMTRLEHESPTKDFGEGIKGMFNRSPARREQQDEKGEDILCRRAAHASYCGLKNEGVEMYPASNLLHSACMCAV